MDDAHFLRAAIAIAKKGMLEEQGGPFGAVIVLDQEIIGEGHNMVTRSNDPTAHAEVLAIRDACQKLGHYDLTGAILYSTCEPCPMCLGAIYWSRLDHYLYACDRFDAAKADFDDASIYNEFQLEPSRRSIPGKQLLRTEGQALFELWKSIPSKIPY